MTHQLTQRQQDTLQHFYEQVPQPTHQTENYQIYINNGLAIILDAQGGYEVLHQAKPGHFVGWTTHMKIKEHKVHIYNHKINLEITTT